jgi:hypothetical protein
MMRRGSWLVSAVLMTLVLAGCTDDTPSTRTASTTGSATAGPTITVLGSRSNTGPFGHSLSMKLVDGPRPISFYVCAAWSRTTPPKGCTARPGDYLPAGALLRLEQQPPGPAVTYPDSPGWGTVGTSDTPQLRAPLSNGVTGNKLGTVTFRATLRDRSGHILATSNRFTVTWHD